nr:PEP-utilizing enzyme [Nitrosomonas nitrosa]
MKRNLGIAGCAKQARISFGTKAETLMRLKPICTQAIVPDLYYFSAETWNSSPELILDEIERKLSSKRLAVRSSALIEDGVRSSMAGAFLSLLGVDGSSRVEIAKAVDQVSQSMTGDDRDQILVQEMVRDVAVCGVIMTVDVQHGSPYYCIEFDDESGLTDTVTGGNGIHKSLFVYRHAEDSLIRSPRVASFLRLARELEICTDCTALDIEFVTNKAGQMFLVQARRITASSKWHPVTERRVKRQLAFVEKFVEDRSKRMRGVLGERTILAVMPDWNPAEIIGTTPRPLASSLYRYLITDSVWRKARAAIGYRQLPATDLMVLINNHPYIDVRNSFNSFLPAQLPDTTGEKLVNAWLARLEEHPELHDKIEFEIVPTCLDFSFLGDFGARYDGVLDDAEYKVFRKALTALTEQCLIGTSLDHALADSSKLARWDMLEIGRGDPYAQLSYAKSLLVECRTLGTVSFAIVARHAFIAETFIRSAVRRGALAEKRVSEFKRSLRTITGNMVTEFSDACLDPVSRTRFLKKYGHLRPGTYEITSLRYDERDDLFSGGNSSNVPTHTPTDFALSREERLAIDSLLQEAGLNVLDAEQLLKYARKAIVGREQVKFEFTRVLSNALSAIVRWGECHGLSRDDLSYLQWQDIVGSLTEPIMEDVDRHYLVLAENGRRGIASAAAFKLSHIISNVQDIYVATVNRSVPNFVGMGSVTGRIVILDANAPVGTNVRNHVVCIENADPGFDWIFTKEPKGLITKFGGANSHMAIRCAELGWPAAIGCGEQLFQRVVLAACVHLDCDQKILRPLNAN